VRTIGKDEQNKRKEKIFVSTFGKVEQGTQSSELPSSGK